MKKILLALIFAVGSLGCWAEGHFMFEGVEMNGNLDAFIQQMDTKGFRKLKVSKDGHSALLLGIYAKYACPTYVFSTDGENMVYKVGVYMPSKSSWSELKKLYLEYRQSLIDKYGQPNSDYMDFSDGYADGDGRELEALYKDACSFYAYWWTELGTVTIGLNEDGADKGQIVTIFEDAANLKLQEVYEAKQQKAE